jgi:hypothetical protein
LLSGHKGEFFLLFGLACLLFMGCGFPASGVNTMREPIPPSHVQVGGKVIELALNNLGIPDGKGREVGCIVEGTDKASELVRIIAPEILLKLDYKIAEKKSTAPELIISVDTLHVTLTKEKSLLAGKRIERFAEAHIHAVLLDADGTRQVFTGKGTFVDNLTSEMLQSVASNDPYVIDRVSRNRFVAKLKPVVIGIAMTVLTWMLYSYRG